jgi:hypothetical protein
VDVLEDGQSGKPGVDNFFNRVPGAMMADRLRGLKRMNSTCLVKFHDWNFILMQPQ